MVTMMEINRDRIRDLVDNHILPLYMVLRETGDMKISLSETQTHRYLVRLLRKAGLQDDAIAAVVDIDKRKVKRIKDSRASDSFNRACELFKNPVLLLKKCDRYGYEYNLSKLSVERMIIEDLILGGWTTRQITTATGFGKRRVQRLRKKLQENTND